MFVLAAIIASSTAIYAVGRGTALMNGFSNLEGQYRDVQELMIISQYSAAYGIGNASFRGALLTSLGIDGLVSMQRNGSTVVLGRYSGHYVVLRGTPLQAHQNS